MTPSSMRNSVTTYWYQWVGTISMRNINIKVLRIDWGYNRCGICVVTLLRIGNPGRPRK